MVCSVLFLLPSLPRAPANHVLAASGTLVPRAFSAHACGKPVPVSGAGVGTGILDEAAHGHMPASAGGVPVPGALYQACELQELPPHTHTSGLLYTLLTLKFPFLALLRFAIS